MICKKCGCGFRGRAKFCKICGAPLPRETGPTGPAGAGGAAAPVNTTSTSGPVNPTGAAVPVNQPGTAVPVNPTETAGPGGYSGSTGANPGTGGGFRKGDTEKLVSW